MIDNRTKTIISIVFLGIILAAAGYFFKNKDIAKPSDIQFTEESSEGTAENQPEPETVDRTEPGTEQDIEPKTEPPTKLSADLQELTTCKYWEDKTFSRINLPETGPTAAGSLRIDGKLRKIGENGVEYVYLVVTEPNTEPRKTFYDFYMDLIEQGNGVNKKDGKKLLFRLGIMEDGKFVTTAEVTDKASKSIAFSAQYQLEIDLNITIPYYAGGGVPGHFTFAC